MIYSCFDAPRGHYRYFADGRTHAVNADLPVPELPRDAGKLGVPASEAGRPLPRGARPTGTGWHARGLVVRCPGGAMGAAPILETAVEHGELSFVVLPALIGAWYGARRGKSPLLWGLGAAGAGVGVFAALAYLTFERGA